MPQKPIPRRTEESLVELCNWVDDYLDKHRYAPSVREIGMHLDRYSSSTAWTIMHRCIAMGWLEINSGEPRTVRTTEGFRTRENADASRTT